MLAVLLILIFSIFSKEGTPVSEYPLCKIRAPESAQTQLVVNFRFKQKVNGTIHLALYSESKQWPDSKKAYQRLTLEVKQQNTAQISIAQLPAGTYSIAAFLDENGNHKIDQNWVGIPTEAYGYSNSARPKYREATWSEAAFQVSGNAKTHQVDVEIAKWQF